MAAENKFLARKSRTSGPNERGVNAQSKCPLFRQHENVPCCAMVGWLWVTASGAGASTAKVELAVIHSLAPDAAQLPRSSKAETRQVRQSGRQGGRQWSFHPQPKWER